MHAQCKGPRFNLEEIKRQSEREGKLEGGSQAKKAVITPPVPHAGAGACIPGTQEAEPEGSGSPAQKF